MIRKYLVWAGVVFALAIIATIAIRPMYWLGSVGFGWIMFWLVVAVGILATYAWVSHNTKSFVKSFLAILLALVLVVGIVVAGVLLKAQQPELTASEVKTIVNMKLPSDSRAVSVEYRGEGIWRVGVLMAIEGAQYSRRLTLVHLNYYDSADKWFIVPSPQPAPTAPTPKLRYNPFRN